MATFGEYLRTREDYKPQGLSKYYGTSSNQVQEQPISQAQNNIPTPVNNKQYLFGGIMNAFKQGGSAYNFLQKVVQSPVYKYTKPASDVGVGALNFLDRFAASQWKDRGDFINLSKKDLGGKLGYNQELTTEEQDRLKDVTKSIVAQTMVTSRGTTAVFESVPLTSLAPYSKTRVLDLNKKQLPVKNIYELRKAAERQNEAFLSRSIAEQKVMTSLRAFSNKYMGDGPPLPKVKNIPIYQMPYAIKKALATEPNKWLNLLTAENNFKAEVAITKSHTIDNMPEELKNPRNFIKGFWDQVLAPAPKRAVKTVEKAFEIERAFDHFLAIGPAYVLGKMKGDDEAADIAALELYERSKGLVFSTREWGESMDEGAQLFLQNKYGKENKPKKLTDYDLEDIGMVSVLGTFNLVGGSLGLIAGGVLGKAGKELKEMALYKKMGQIKKILPEGTEFIKKGPTLEIPLAKDLKVTVTPKKNEIVIKGFAKRSWKPTLTPVKGKTDLSTAVKDLESIIQRDTSMAVEGVMRGQDLVLQPAITTRLLASEAGFAKLPGKETDPLTQEAKKYESAEEFAEAQPVVYHGSPTPLKSFSNKKGGVFFTEEYADATGFAGSPDNVYEGYLNFKKPLVIDAKGAKWDKLNTKYGKSTQEVINNAQKDGYDGVIFNNIVDNIGDTADIGGQSTISYAYKPQDSFLNDSQLTDMWNKANKTKPKEVKAKAAKAPEWAVKKEQKMLPAPEDYTTGKGFEMKPGKKATAKQIIAREKPKKLKEKVLKKKGITDLQERIMRKQADLPPVNQMKPEHIAKYKELINKFDDIEVLPGKKLKDAVKIKVEPNKQVSAVITKQDLANIEKDFKGKIKPEWVKKWSIANIADTLKSGGRVYELPQIFFENTGLKKYIYDPIRHYGERAASAEKTKLLNRFKEAKLYKEGGWFTADKFKINKRQSKQIGKYYLERQGKKTGVKYTDLKPKEKQFVDIFDDIIKDTEDEFFAVARHNGKEINKVKNYAPLMTADDIKRIDKGGDMDFIMRKHPAFFSLKERQKVVPVNMYESDYRKVVSRWIDGMTKFNKVGQFTPQVKYLINSEEFSNIVGGDIAETTNVWFKSVLNPDVPTHTMKGVNALARFLRKTTAVASLGLNYASVVKQILTQVPLTIIEKAPPKLRSKFAKDFGIKISDLPSIQERKGMISIADMQDKLGKMFTGPLAKFDKTNAQLSLNRLLDKNYKKYLKQGAEVSPELQDLILKKSQDTLDMWYGGMTKSQLSPAFRTDVGKMINMFIQPLTSQLNGFYQSVFRAKGIRKFEKFAEVATAAVVIAFMEQVITNLSFDWDDKKSMVKDTLASLAGNVPVLSQLVYSFRSDQPIQATALLSGMNNLRKEINKESKDFKQIGLKSAEILGLPKQFRRTTEGIEVIKEKGVVDKRGKLLAPVVDTMEQIRAFLRGKYGALAAQDYVENIGKTRENRSWNNPEVEFLQNGDWARRMEVMDDIEEDELKSLVSKMSDGQKEEYNRWRFAKEFPDATEEELGSFYKSVGLDKDGKMSSVQYEAFEEKARLLEFQEKEPDIHEKILNNKEIEKISTDNALRAKYIYKELMKKSAADQKDWYAELKEKEIIDDSTDEQLNELWANPNFINK